VDFEVVVSGFDEASVGLRRPEAQARSLARAKALVAAVGHPDAVVLGADTVVAYRGEQLGKPADAREARAMLERLRDRTHRVITGVALVVPSRRSSGAGGAVRVTDLVSRVLMRRYSDAEVEAAIEAGVPFDKAGGYGIQDPVLRPVEACDGCYCNVMGLPLWTVASLLGGAGIAVNAEAMPARCAVCPERPKSATAPESADSGILGS
jgi:MAF protein